MGEEVELFCAAVALGREREREVFAAVATQCAMGGELAARFLGDKLLQPSAASKPGEQAADEISGGEILLELPKGSARPPRVLAQLWEDPDFARNNALRVPKLNQLLGGQTAAEQEQARRAEAAAALQMPTMAPLASAVLTIQPPPPKPQQPPPPSLGTPAASSKGAAAASAAGARRCAKAAGGSASPSPLQVSSAKPRNDAAALAGDGVGDVEVLLKGRKGLGRDYKVTCRFEISIF